MQVGVLQIFQNYLGRGQDADVVEGERQLAVLADELGYDRLWAVEHHFTDYAACPDNVAYLSWLAGRTERIRLGTGAVIVPWNDPLRVAEKFTLLDHLSDGRAELGLGRGLSRIEYAHFGIDMGTSRERFDEGADMIVEALESGVIEGDGPFYPQPRTEIRPRPLAPVRDRLYCVGMSPDSVQAAARLGGRLTTFTQTAWELYADGPLQEFREAWKRHHDGDPPAPLTGDLMYCHPDPAQAEEKGLEYMTNYFLTIVKHYEIMSDHFKDTKGYDSYASASEAFKAVGLETAARAYCAVNSWGDPARILSELEKRRKLVGDFQLNLISFYGGMSLAEAEESLRLFAAEVLPVVHSW